MQGRAGVLVVVISLLGGALMAACGTSVARPSPSPKASPPRATTPASLCATSQVSGRFWIDSPGMSKAMEGITFT
ncbi:MAG: hypothetical protein WB867_02685, partial [Candidatus Dormiibacterota bacterium]